MSTDHTAIAPAGQPGSPAHPDPTSPRQALAPPPLPRLRPSRIPPRRPGNVSAAGWILVISGLAGMVGSAVVFYFGNSTPTGNSAAFGVTVAGMAAGGLINYLLGRAIRQGKQWARITTIVLYALGIAGSLTSGLIYGGAALLGAVVTIIVSGAMIALLTGKAANEFFRFR